jgi:hypothetical protein
MDGGSLLFVHRTVLPMKSSGAPAVSLLILLLVLLPASLAAISIFDVIRLSQEGYADDEIVRILRATDSRFVLSSEDVLRLRQEGVTETVIREMLSRPAPERKVGTPAPPMAAQPLPGAPTPGQGGGNKPGHAREVLFAGSPYAEAGTSQSTHAAVTLAGIEVLILRDRAGFPTPLSRARAVAAKLNGLAARASGHFAARETRGESKVVFETSGGRDSDVLTATPADAAAYRASSRRDVSPLTLASFWAALLNDYWSIAVAGKPPRYLTDSREGEALAQLSLAVGGPAGPRDSAAIRAAFDSLEQAERLRLHRLPAAVPEELDFPVRRSP